MLGFTGRIRLAPQLWISIAWLAFAMADATKTVGSMHAEGMHHSSLLLFAIDSLSWLPWAVGSLVVIWLADRLRTSPRSAQWSVHVTMAIAIGLAYTAWSDQLIVLFQPFAPDYLHWAAQWPSDFFSDLPVTAVLYGCVLLGYNFFESRARFAAHESEMAQLNEQLAHAHLRALRSQIEPHFLFNALNTVAGLVREGRSDAAIDMVVQLSDFLRRSLSEINQHEVPLAGEMEFARRYLTIQQARFSDRLRLDIEMPESLRDAAVPDLILQPLVENAVKHGIAKSKDGGVVRIVAAAAGDVLDLSVSNDGPNLSDHWNAPDQSIGIANVCKRLRSLYGDASSFAIRNRHGGGVEVLIRIPHRTIDRAGRGPA